MIRVMNHVICEINNNGPLSYGASWDPLKRSDKKQNYTPYNNWCLSARETTLLRLSGSEFPNFEHLRPESEESILNFGFKNCQWKRTALS